ncbi:hypothetical protein ScPMuIL_001452 [Solemya velum]
MKKNYVWIVGFNGFHQVDSFCGTCTDVKCKSENNLRYPEFVSNVKHSTPSETSWLYDVLDDTNDTGSDKRLLRTIIGWSRILIVSGTGKGFYNGRNSISECSDCLSAVSLKSDLVVGHTSGEFILLKDQGPCSIKIDEKNPMTDTSQINKMDATEASIYCSFENGNLEQWRMETSSDSNTPCLFREPIQIKERIKQLACGKEHVLLLTEWGVVYSLGNGSRGQLGHDSVENETAPRVVSMLEGVKMCTVSAGGWHSTVISEFGDLYVWGWNECGQLGFPNADSRQGRRQSERHYKPLQLPKPRENFASENVLIAASAQESSQHVEHKGILEVSDEKEDTQVIPLLGSEMNPRPCFHEKSSVETCTKRNVSSDCESDEIRTDNSPLEFPQVCEGFQFQTVPRLVELDEQTSVLKASCGSRHTVILLDSGVLLSTGWNEYGQLGLGDWKSRDRFVSVPRFYRNNQRIIDVCCGHWNTVFVGVNTD